MDEKTGVMDTTQEFKYGDRVLCRENDLQEWKEYTFIRLCKQDDFPFEVIGDNDATIWQTQCRHTYDLRAGDKVQCFNSDKGEWEDGKYVGRVNSRLHSVIMPNGRYGHYLINDIRWHPEIPWAHKIGTQLVTVEQRVEMERKTSIEQNEMKASSVGHYHQWFETNYPQQGDGVLILKQGRDKPTFLAVHVRGQNLGHIREYKSGDYVQLTYKIASYERKGSDGRKYWVTMLWFSDMISADK